MLGALFIGAWSLKNEFPPSSFVPSPDESLKIPTKTVPLSGAVSVANQSAGSSVTIESVTVPPPGVWIAVREIQ